MSDIEMGSINDHNDKESLVYDLSGGAGDGEVRRKKLALLAENTPMEIFTGVTAGISVVSSIVAYIVSKGSIVLIAAILSTVMGPYAYWQQTRLTDIKALKETHEALENEVNTLHSENVRLSDNVKNLASTVDRLADVETALAVVNQTQGKSVESFKEQVQENKDLLASMEKNLKAAVLQNLLDVVMGSDSDGDDKLDDDEINKMIRRLHSINGVIVNDEKLRLVIAQKNRSIDSIIEVIKDVIQDGSDGSDHIFTFQ